jgi:ABC-type amino acid transport substrate-binding protein
MLLVAAIAAGGASAQESTAVKELIPRGKLRVGIVFAPAASAFFVVKDASGEPHGVTVDLAIELAKKLGVPVEFMLAANSGLVTDATESGAVDVGFMPVDEERKKRVDFGPAYFMIESTYLASAASGIKTVAEVDRPNVRVVGIANTTTIRAATRSLKNTTISAAASVEEAMALLRAGKADAFAAALGDAIAGLADCRRRLSADRHRDRRPEEPAERACLCHRVPATGEGLRQRAARAGQGRLPERAGSAIAAATLGSVYLAVGTE